MIDHEPIFQFKKTYFHRKTYVIVDSKCLKTGEVTPSTRGVKEESVDCE
jgi:hypothetical protein